MALKIFPAVVNVNSNFPEKRARMILINEEVPLLPEININMINRYITRPSMKIINELCYVLLPKMKEEDSQPIELTDEIIEIN